MPTEIKFIRMMSSGLFTGRLSVGYYELTPKTCVLIDSGLEDNGAKEVEKTLKARGITPVAIINTHFHADHCGGNDYFQRKYPQIRVYATTLEKPFIEHPELEPLSFSQGAEPFAELRNKFLQCKSSRVTHTIEKYEMQVIDIDGEKFTIVPMSGHTPQMIGVITPDKVLYAGDALFGAETFNKHGVLFYTNIGNTLNSLASLKDLDIRAAVLYHGGIVDNKQALIELADQHVAKLEETYATLLGYINDQGRCSLSDVTKFAMNKFNVPDNVIQYTLTETPVKAFLQFMQKKNQVNLTVQNGALFVNSTHNAVNVAKI